ncbi:MAG: sigma-70 family RNA polymerase sigma factor [Gallionella sp.]|nr:sigma-70 family RNA polymerase sigma factor [Gallionella sp.]MDD4946995.1 sigma-70 family RNA polymerase sigma factor [Gallionella sp.]MDD5612668.1 sigma-70 family RNA polymerase sigma factor [Gallionella sp.]
MSDNETETRALLRRIAGGGRPAEAAMEQLFRLYASRIKAFFRHHRMTDEEAADLLQETFIKVYRSADKFKGESKVSTWVWTIARNCMLDYLRSKKSHDSLDELLEEGDSPEVLIDDAGHEDQRDMRNCVQRGFLSFAQVFPERAYALRLAAFEGWEMDELANFLSRTPAATREYISQCRKKLSPFLEPCRAWLEA